MFGLLIYLQCRWKLWNSGEVHELIQIFLKQTNCKQSFDIQSLQVALQIRWFKPWNIFRTCYLFQLSRIIYPLHLSSFVYTWKNMGLHPPTEPPPCLTALIFSFWSGEFNNAGKDALVAYLCSSSSHAHVGKDKDVWCDLGGSLASDHGRRGVAAAAATAVDWGWTLARCACRRATSPCSPYCGIDKEIRVLYLKKEKTKMFEVVTFWRITQQTEV